MRLNRTGFSSLLLAALLLSVVGSSQPAAQGAKSTSSAKKAKSTSKPKAGADSVLVRIGKETITTGQVQRRLDELPEHVRPQFTTPEGRQRLVDRMIEEKVWLMSAQKQGVDKRPDVKQQIEQQRRDLLIRTHINEVMATNPPPSDSAARVYYDEHRADYRTPASITISHIQSKSEADAKKVKGYTKKQDWGKLVAKYSADTLTKKQGGVLGPVTHEGVFGQLGRQPALAESAFALGGTGKIGGPYKTDRGWHVIRVESITPEGERPFDQVRGGIIRQMSQKASQDFYGEKYAQAKASLGLRADSVAIEKFVMKKKSARDLFNDAQAAGGPQERIVAYTKVLQEYPDSEVSPQAQFMIGFIQSEELKDYPAAEQTFQTLLKRYPKSELAASAKWMVEHMRTETAPGFMNLESDSTKSAGSNAAPGRKP